MPRRQLPSHLLNARCTTTPAFVAVCKSPLNIPFSSPKWPTVNPPERWPGHSLPFERALNEQRMPSHAPPTDDRGEHRGLLESLSSCAVHADGIRPAIGRGACDLNDLGIAENRVESVHTPMLERRRGRLVGTAQNHDAPEVVGGRGGSRTDSSRRAPGRRRRDRRRGRPSRRLTCRRFARPEFRAPYSPRLQSPP